jgi:hypothetical protein
MVFESLMTALKDRHFRGMKAQTAQLDAASRAHLQEFLEDVPAEQDELKIVQAELDDAHARLRHLEEKEAFVGTRLASYQSQIAAKEEQGEPVDPKHVEALIQIDASHKTMVRGIAVMEERIDHMELRQHELSQKTEECQVVYETAERLQALQMEDEQNEKGKQNLALDVNVGVDVDVESATTELDKDVEVGAGADATETEQVDEEAGNATNDTEAAEQEQDATDKPTTTTEETDENAALLS